MGDHIIGIKKIKETSATVKGANEHSVKLFRKSFSDKPTPTPKTDPVPDPVITEESEMDVKIIKALAVLSDAGRGYVAQLEDDKVKSFFEQDKAAQDAEIKTWDEAEKAKAADAAEAEKAKSAKDPVIAALETEVATLRSEREIEKSDKRTREIEKRAETEFPKVPKAAEILKSIDGLSAAAQAPTIALLKSQQDMAKNFGTVLGADDAVPGDATTKYEALVDEVSKTKSISKSAAAVEIAGDRNHAALVAQMRAETAG